MLVFASVASAGGLSVRQADGREETYATIEVGPAEYLAASDVSLLFGASLYFRPDLLKMTFRVGDHRVKVTADNPNVVIDGDGVHLPAPVLYRDGEVLLPFRFVIEGLAPLAPVPAHWDEETRVLRFGSTTYRVIGVDTAARGNGLEITVRTSGRPAFREDEGEEGELLIRFPGTHLQSDSLPPPRDGGVLEEWSWETSGDTVTLRLVPSPEAEERRVARQLRPEAVVIRLAPSAIEDMVGGASGAVEVLTKPRRVGGAPAPAVVIDAGHGGADSGCVGSGGLVEKDVTLDLAIRVRALLQSRGVPVVLTREEDVNLSLEARTEAANASGGALFVSLHVNGSPVRTLSGTEVYILSHGRGARERIQRAVEEATTVYRSEPLGGVLGVDLRFVPWDAVQEEHAARSGEAARAVQNALGRISGFESRGVRETPAAVLRGVNMPAILLELGFLTNPGAESAFAREDVRADLAGRLASAIAGIAGGSR